MKLTRPVFAGLLFLTLSVSAARAIDAYEVAGEAPAESIAVMAWAGADQAANGFAASRLGRLWAEPTVRSFLRRPALSGWAWLEEEAVAKVGQQRWDTIEAALGSLWAEPLFVCAVPAKKTPGWPVSLGLGVVLRVDAESHARAEALLSWIREETGKELVTRTIEGVAFVQPDAKADGFFAHLDDRWILAFSEEAARALARKGGPTFADSEMHRRAREKTAVKAPFYYACFDTRQTWKLVAEAAGIRENQAGVATRPSEDQPLVIAYILASVMLGGGIFGSAEVGSAMTFDGDYVARTSYALADPQHPLPFDHLSSRPIDRAWLREVPGDASYFFLGTWEPRKVWSVTLDLIEQFMPEARKTRETVEDNRPMRERIREALGFDIERELIGHLGEHVLLYMEGGGMTPGVVVALEVSDAPALQRCLDDLLTRLPKEIRFTDRTVGRDTLHVIDLPTKGPVNFAALFSPCWALTGDRLVFGLTPDAATRYLQRRTATQPATQPIANRPAVRDFLAGYNGPQLASIEYVNEPESLMPTYVQLGMFYPIAIQALREQAPRLRFSVLPPPPDVEKHLGESVSWSTVDGNVRIQHERTGVPVLAGGFGVMKTAMAISILLPSLARAREVSRRAVCAANLKGIGAATRSYAAEHEGKLPPDFRTLVEAGSVSPRMFVCPSSDAPFPGEQPTEEELAACYTYVPAPADTEPAKQVLVYEKVDCHGGEGGHVLFADGHVEFVKADRLAELAGQSRERMEK